MPAKYGYGETKVRNSPAPSKKWLKKAKAKEMLKHGSVRGKKLTDKQRKFFGTVMDSAMDKRNKKRKKA